MEFTSYAGSWPVATGHLVTAIIGAGVLGLPHSMALLGWVGGVAALVVFFVITLWCLMMLASVYEVNGRKHTRYKDAVYFILGEIYASYDSVVPFSLSKPSYAYLRVDGCLSNRVQAMHAPCKEQAVPQTAADGRLQLAMV